MMTWWNIRVFNINERSYRVIPEHKSTLTNAVMFMLNTKFWKFKEKLILPMVLALCCSQILSAQETFYVSSSYGSETILELKSNLVFTSNADNWPMGAWPQWAGWNLSGPLMPYMSIIFNYDLKRSYNITHIIRLINIRGINISGRDGLDKINWSSLP